MTQKTRLAFALRVFETRGTSVGAAEDSRRKLGSNVIQVRALRDASAFVQSLSHAKEKSYRGCGRHAMYHLESSEGLLHLLFGRGGQDRLQEN